MSFVDPKLVAKIALAGRIGRFLGADHSEADKAEIAQVAMTLARDDSTEVRSVLAHAVRDLADLPPKLAHHIARDVDEVAVDFLARTPAFGIDDWIKLITEASPAAQEALARRDDLPWQLYLKIADVSAAEVVNAMLRNDHVRLPFRVHQAVLNRFIGDDWMIEQLSQRRDLTANIVEQVLHRVSDRTRANLMKKMGVDKPSERATPPGDHPAETSALALDKAPDTTIPDTGVPDTSTPDTVGSGGMQPAEPDTPRASPATQTSLSDDAPRNAESQIRADQVHSRVRNMRSHGRLTHISALDLAEKEHIEYAVATVALESGATFGEVRNIFRLDNTAEFVHLLKRAGVSQTLAPRYLALAKQHFGQE